MTEHSLPLNASRPVALQALMVVFLYSLPLLLTIRPVTVPDIWWHLREGPWIAEHRTVPVTDTFSTYRMGKRSIFDLIMLAVTLGGAFVLGRQKDIRPFPALLVASGVFLSFRAARDVWFVVVAALMVLAAYWSGRDELSAGYRAPGCSESPAP